MTRTATRVLLSRLGTTPNWCGVVRIVGVTSAAAMLAGWLVVLAEYSLGFNDPAAGVATVPVLMAIFSAAALLWAYRAYPLLMVATGIALFWPAGFYLTFAPAPFVAVGVCAVIYLASGLLLALCRGRASRVAG